MPEGPSIVIAKEELQQFIGKRILTASGSSKIEMNRLKNKKIIGIKTFGKHLLLCFDGFTIRIHFLMFGKYFINSSKPLKPTLALTFARGKELNFYTSAITMIEVPLEEVYDWTADVMNENWSATSAKKKMKKMPERMIVDILLDQEIFAGVGNIIKNEVLYRTKIHPTSLGGDIPPKKITELCKEVIIYTFQFLEWKKISQLAKYWEVYTKKKCKRDGSVIKKGYLGKGQRRTYFCDACQVVYA
ncbi:MAG: DNA-formamidopyrimidine glycosylase family protein [Flavitalea sp.]